MVVRKALKEQIPGSGDPVSKSRYARGRLQRLSSLDEEGGVAETLINRSRSEGPSGVEGYGLGYRKRPVKRPQQATVKLPRMSGSRKEALEAQEGGKERTRGEAKETRKGYYA